MKKSDLVSLSWVLKQLVINVKIFLVGRSCGTKSLRRRSVLGSHIVFIIEIILIYRCGSLLLGVSTCCLFLNRFLHNTHWLWLLLLLLLLLLSLLLIFWDGSLNFLRNYCCWLWHCSLLNRLLLYGWSFIVISVGEWLLFIYSLLRWFFFLML